MNAACHFYLGTALLFLDMPIMLIKPKQRMDRWGVVHYEFYQEYLFPEDEQRAKMDFKIHLVYNGINYYAPFYAEELADLITEGDPVMLQIQQSHQDVKSIISRLPKNTQINGVMQQIAVHMRASVLIAGSVCFQSGIGDTSTVSQLPFPVNTGVLKDPVTCKRKATATTTTVSQQPGTSSQPATGPTPAKVANVSLIGSDHTDIDFMPNQCHCGQAFDSQADVKRHVKVVHRNEYWGCSGEWVWDDGTESHCPKVCKDKFVL